MAQEIVQHTEKMIKNRIHGHGRGWCFTPKDFSDLGSSEAIRIALFRLNKERTIRRITHGLYDFPRKHQKLGDLPPRAEDIANAIARRDHIRFLASGAYAANLLGISEQVPGKIVFLTEGAPKTIEFGKMKIMFKKTTPKNMALANSVSGHVVQAFKFIGKENITTGLISHLKKRLGTAEKRRLKKDASLAPAWITKIILRELAG
ncbi:MAG: hypothetical protein JWQ35_2389 [Bacteriovoracaceae bacterium]|nr:hypothetical protein [Bacteriovoracaceae bacterium]